MDFVLFLLSQISEILELLSLIKAMKVSVSKNFRGMVISVNHQLVNFLRHISVFGTWQLTWNFSFWLGWSKGFDLNSLKLICKYQFFLMFHPKLSWSLAAILYTSMKDFYFCFYNKLWNSAAWVVSECVYYIRFLLYNLVSLKNIISDLWLTFWVVLY